MDTSHLYRAIKFYSQAITVNSIHSPLLFELVSTLFAKPKTYYADDVIERQRQALKESKKVIHVVDYGAGSYKRSNQSIERRVSSIARSATSNRAKCRFLRNLVLYFRPSSIIEFGTNLGISTAYMKSALGNQRPYHTIEADEATAAIATDFFIKMRFGNLNVHRMTFSTFIEQHTALLKASDFIYLDGDHQYESTMTNFKAIWQAWDGKQGRQVIVVDDINWSAGMAQAWTEIKATPHCRSLDFFKLGVVIKDSGHLVEEHLSVVPRWVKPWRMGFWG